jgi:hypothetical protein
MALVSGEVLIQPTYITTALTVFCPFLSGLVGPDHHSAKKVFILTMKLWKMKKSSDFDREIMNLVEKNVGTPAFLGRTLH